MQHATPFAHTLADWCWPVTTGRLCIHSAGRTWLQIAPTTRPTPPTTSSSRSIRLHRSVPVHSRQPGITRLSNIVSYWYFHNYRGHGPRSTLSLLDSQAICINTASTPRGTMRTDSMPAFSRSARLMRSGVGPVKAQCSADHRLDHSKAAAPKHRP